MKIIRALLAIAAIILPLQAMASNASWTNWTAEGGQEGTLVQDGNEIDVTYDGDIIWNDTGYGDGTSSFHDIFAGASFTDGFYEAPPLANGTIAMQGGNGGSFGVFTFSEAVVNPLLALWSVGQSGLSVRFVFDTENFAILSQGAGAWGGGSLVKNENVVTGFEGNGLIQFFGTFNEIAFELPDNEYYFGATVGAPSILPVPLPAGLPLMMTGLGLLGFGSLRKASARAR